MECFGLLSNRMGKRLFLTTLLGIYGYATFGSLITKPKNVALILWNWRNFSMTCSSTLGSSSISWYFVPVGESINFTIASGSIVYPSFTHEYRIDQPTINASNLIVLSPNTSTAGTFTCSDTEMVANAQLLSVHDFPVSSNISNSLIVGDVVMLSCNITYVGNPIINPIFQLYDELGINRILIDNCTSPQLSKSNLVITATATFYQSVSCSTFQNILCITSFGQPEGNLLPGSATEAPIHTFINGVYLSNVACVPTDKNMTIAGAVSGALLYFGGMLTCYVTSVPPADYSWTDLTYGNSSTGNRLTVWHGGSYQCNARNYLNGQWYSASKIVYNLTVEKLSSMATPLYGPIAGGTKVTVTLNNWSKQVTNISAVYLGGILNITALQSHRSSNSFVMTTLNATPAQIGQLLPITIEFAPGPYNINTKLSFIYRDNPTITDIGPSTFVVTGGTSVNVTGEELSSVANPLIQVTIIVERGIPRNSTSETSFESCEVIAGDGRKMICRMPPIKIPDDFLKVLDSQYHHINTRDTHSIDHIAADKPSQLSRRKRSLRLGALSLNGSNGVDRVVVYLGFILDGHRKYENINDALPETKLWFYSPPEINFTKEILEFDPTKDEFISIKGKYMTRGCRISDYLVQIGGDVCENDDLQDNQLSCRPSKVKPSSTLNDTIVCEQHLSVTITLGNVQYHYACLTYADQSSTRKLALIIGITVGLTVFILFLVIFIVCIVRCCRGKSSKQVNKQYSSGRQESRNPPYENAVQLESPRDDVHLRQQYDNAIWSNEGYLAPAKFISQ